MRIKSDLPSKTCAVCGRPFAWRKKWERSWNEVKYCSQRCRGRRGGAVDVGPGGTAAETRLQEPSTDRR